MLGLPPIDVINMLDSPYCENEVLLWDLKNGLAIEGINWLAQEKEETEADDWDTASGRPARMRDGDWD